MAQFYKIVIFLFQLLGMSYNHENWQVDAEKYCKKFIGMPNFEFSNFKTFYGQIFIFFVQLFLEINKIQKIEIPPLFKFFAILFCIDFSIFMIVAHS